MAELPSVSVEVTADTSAAYRAMAKYNSEMAEMHRGLAVSFQQWADRMSTMAASLPRRPVTQPPLEFAGATLPRLPDHRVWELRCPVHGTMRTYHLPPRADTVHYCDHVAADARGVRCGRQLEHWCVPRPDDDGKQP